MNTSRPGRSDSSSFARRTWLIAAGQTSVKASQLVLAVVLVRLLSPSDWNEAAFLLSIYLAGTTLGTLNVHHSIIYFLPRVASGQQRSLVFQNMRLLAGLGGLVVVALTLAAPLLSGGRLGEADRIPWLALAIAFELPAACVSMALIGTARFEVAALWDLGGTILILIGAVVPAAAGLGVPGLIAGLLVTAVIRAAAGAVAIVITFPSSTSRVPTGVMLDQLRYGLPLGLTIAVAMTNRLVDKWYIAAFHSGDFGVYAIAAQEVPLLAVLPYAGGAALATGLVEAFRAGDRQRAHASWMTLTTSMTLVVVPLGVGLILVAPELMTALFTPDFGPGVLPFQLFTFITLHRVAEYGMLLRAAGRTQDVLAVAAWTLASNAILAGFGAWYGGMTGASIGTVIASAIGWWIAMRRIAATFAVPVSAAFPWATWLAVLCGSFLAAGAGQLVAAGSDHAATRVMLKLLTFSLAVVPVVSVARRLFDMTSRSVAADRGLTVVEAA